MRRCCDCRVEKPLDAFCKAAKESGGRSYYCRECMKVRQRAYRSSGKAAEAIRRYQGSPKGQAKRRAYEERNRSRLRAMRESWKDSPKGKDSARLTARKWRASHPERYRAHLKVRRALTAGKLAAAPCEVCGTTTVDAHHDDYSKPLDVRWLCRAHHAEHHHRMAE